MLTLNQVFKFLKPEPWPEHCKKALPNSELSQNLINVSHEYSREMCHLQLYQKRDSGADISYEFCEMSKITFFTEHLWETASVYDMTMVLTV